MCKKIAIFAIILVIIFPFIEYNNIAFISIHF